MYLVTAHELTFCQRPDTVICIYLRMIMRNGWRQWSLRTQKIVPQNGSSTHSLQQALIGETIAPQHSRGCSLLFDNYATDAWANIVATAVGDL